MFHVEVFWVVMPCSDVVAEQRFGGPCCLHLQGHNPEDLGLKLFYTLFRTTCYFRNDENLILKLNPLILNYATNVHPFVTSSYTEYRAYVIYKFWESLFIFDISGSGYRVLSTQD
jgi:hypothetical protein